MGLGKHVEKKEDTYSIGSRQKLKAAMRHKIKRTFVAALDIIEKELDKNSDAFKRMRSRILSEGNDQIRNMEIELERYNVEFIPYQMVFLPMDRLGDNDGK